MGKLDMYDDGGPFRAVLAGLICAVLIVVFVASKGCANEDATRATLQAAGYTDVMTTGFEFSCSQDDDQCTGFRATGPTGVKVKGAVGCGWFFKGCTIRVEP